MPPFLVGSKQLGRKAKPRPGTAMHQEEIEVHAFGGRPVSDSEALLESIRGESHVKLLGAPIQGIPYFLRATSGLMFLIFFISYQSWYHDYAGLGLALAFIGLSPNSLSNVHCTFRWARCHIIPLVCRCASHVVVYHVTRIRTCTNGQGSRW